MGLARVVAAAVALVLAGACAGSGDDAQPGPSTPATTTGAPTRPTISPPPLGVETFTVTGGHTEEPVSYPQTPPVGGIHHPMWQPCVFYETPVPTEKAVHSLEHGAVWITYRPDIPQDQKALLALLSRGRGGVLVSRWDEGLPAPVVATSWGRQIKLDSAADPRLIQFIASFVGHAPEPAGSCA